MADEYFINTRIDLRFDLDGFDHSEADSVLVLYERPDDVSGEWTGTKFGDKIQYITSALDMPIKGTWKVQACAVYGSERKKGKICYLTLKEPLN